MAAPVVLVSFDADDAGEDAAGYWLDRLPNARRWRTPWTKDASGFLQDGGDVWGWVVAGLEASGIEYVPF